MPHLPCRGRRRLPREPALQCQGQPRRTIRQRSVMNVPAGCEVAGQRRRQLPHLPPTARKLIIRLCERLPPAHPNALPQKNQQHDYRNFLREPESKLPELVRRSSCSHQPVSSVPNDRQPQASPPPCADSLHLDSCHTPPCPGESLSIPVPLPIANMKSRPKTRTIPGRL